MNAEEILHASPLDIIFDGRNKSYGAYPLRKDYNKRLSVSLLLTTFCVATLIITYMRSPIQLVEAAPRITSLAPDIKPETVNPVLPPPQPRLPKPASIHYAGPPLIIKDELMTAREAPPENSVLDNVAIGFTNEAGIQNDLNLAPPSNSVIADLKALRKDNADDFVPVEIESGYPGGPQAWKRFLLKTFRYPEEAQENYIEGIVLLQFIVDVDGTVTEIKAVQGPVALREEAERVIRKSGRWTPAMQNGRKVRSQKFQQIIFSLASE